jgi:hypothetical protein
VSGCPGTELRFQQVPRVIAAKVREADLIEKNDRVMRELRDTAQA